MSWIDDCIDDLNEILNDCEIEYYEPEDENRREYISIYNGSDSLWDYYDDIDNIAKKYDLTIQDYDSSSVDLINLE